MFFTLSLIPSSSAPNPHHPAPPTNLDFQDYKSSLVLVWSPSIPQPPFLCKVITHETHMLKKLTHDFHVSKLMTHDFHVLKKLTHLFCPPSYFRKETEKTDSRFSCVQINDSRLSCVEKTDSRFSCVQINDSRFSCPICVYLLVCQKC